MENLCRCDIVNIDVTKSLTRTYAGLVLATGDNNANKFGVNVYRNGEPLDVTGYNVLGYFIRPDMATLPVPGKAEGNTAYVELPSACYTNSGNFSLAIKITGEDITQTVRVVDGCIRLTQTDAVVDPGEVVPSLDELLLAIEYMETATEEAKAATEDAKSTANGILTQFGELAPAIVCEASGNIVTITDAAARPAVQLVSTIKAVQEGEENTSETGKNLFGGIALARKITSLDANAVLDEEAKTITYAPKDIVGETLYVGPFKSETQYTIRYLATPNVYSDEGLLRVRYTDGSYADLSGANMAVSPFTTVAGKTVEKIVMPPSSVPSRVIKYEEQGIFEGKLTYDDFEPYVEPRYYRPIRGWDSINVCGTRKNLLVIEDYTDNLDGYTETCSAGVITRAIKKQHSTTIMARPTSRALTARLPAGTYIFTLTYISANAKFTKPYVVVTLDSGEVIQLPHGTAVTLDQSGTITGFRCESTSFGASTGEIVYTLQIEKGDTATEYGLGQGRKLTASLPETVYGGKANWTAGKTLVTHAGRVLDGTESWMQYTSGAKPYYYIDVGKGGSVINGTGVCSHYVTVRVASDTTNLGYYIVNSSSGNARLVIRPDITVFPDVAAWKAYLAEQYAAGTPVTCTYELAQPYTIQLEPQQLDMLRGLNHVWSDCGEMSITYVADTKMYIDGKLDEIMSSIINAQQEEQ